MDTSLDHDATSERKPSQLSTIVNRVVHNPLQFRVILVVAIFGSWYLGIASPWSVAIDETTKRTEVEKTRLKLAEEVEQLRVQVDHFKDRLPRNTDANEWLQYMLAAIREFPLKMSTIDTQGLKDIGPYKADIIKMTIEGNFEDIDAFLRWIETNPRLFRINEVHLAPARGSRKMVAQLTLLGVMG